ncbi:MAG: PAS domain-containing sensor histidine kinase [Nitrospinae bacterium CG11_big_fil_rev_8_21_14_0_20_56_8]|nr:MAG: PAS domain-containing sensor histidine kinase [Nitrospinae bacterium CG11_big_fil_rev_8_21_14_0_20_56_8]
MTEPHPKLNKEQIEILNRAFQAFNDATQQLQSSYENLQERIKVLDLELARKNEELEKNLQEKEAVKNYLHNILESLTTGVIVVDGTGEITTFNRTAGSIAGLEPENCIGKRLKTVFQSDLFDNIVNRLARTGQQQLALDREIATAQGRKIHVRISASPLTGPGDEAIGTVLIVQDITQILRLEEEAQRNQRLRATGEMAAGIAHEIRNPLASIELFASLLKKDLEGDEEKRKLAEHISSGVKNMDRIISSVLLFAKSAQPSRQKCDLAHLLVELTENSSDILIPANVKIVRQFTSGNVMANGDDALLKQVFLNLIRNGIQAMPGGGELRLTTAIETGPDGKRGDHRNYLTVTVADTGVGIPRDQFDQIFNPFFTTKDRGTGLGLAISHNIIKAHQGTIHSESEEGKGTAFVVKIPCWDEELDEK